MSSHRFQAAGRLRPGTIVMAAVVVSSLLVSPPVIVAAARPRSLSTPTVPAVHGTPVRATGRPADLTQGANAPRTGHVSWPGPDSAVVSIASVPGEGAAAVKASVVDRATLPAGWRNGVVLRLAGADQSNTPGPTQVTVDYAPFADGFGGDYGARLRLVQLPPCALESDPDPSCQVTPIPSVNDATAQTVTADVTVPASGGDAVFALAAGASSTSGTFAATPLKPSSTWSAGGNSGDFSWQDPIATPPGLGGPAPTVALSYSSASVDGRNATTNNQPNWVGEGFDYAPGQITRAYKSCADDEGGGANNTSDTGDECWGTDNAVLSMSGHAGELIKDDASGTWRVKGDDNTKIEHLTGAINGDNDGEYWRLTTADGTRYFFGLNRLPGFTGTAPANKVTNSAWTVPVAGNNTTEPCHASTFTASFCAQAWQWNLDYVVDTHGNTMSVFYTQETNKYARNNTDSDVQTYVRSGYVDHIDYGTDQRGTGGVDTEQTATLAPTRVQFATADRCLSACATHDVAHWPDTPWDQSCTSSTSCPGIYSPAFFTTKRLAKITTEVSATGATCGSTAGYKCVDLWALTHDFPPSGDDTRNGMWLDSIVHTGQATGGAVVGSAVSLPAINFDWTQLPNRVDTDPNNPPMNWMRLSTIWTETGGKISIRYTPQDCTPTSLPTSPQANTRRCYPVLEKQPDKSIKTEYFNRYLVATVTQADTTGGGLDVATSYTYVGNPGWRHADDDGLTKDNLRTWSVFRGYPQVNTQIGAIGQGQQTLSETTFFQGMNGDLNGSGGTRLVTLPAIDVNGDGDTTDVADSPAVTDNDAFSGRVRQTTVFNGSQSAPVSTTVNQPWQSAPTATRDMGQTTVYARHTGVATTWTGTKLAAGGWRVARSNTTFDSYGMTTQIDDAGDVAVSGDETCSKSSYNRNTSANLLEVVSETDVYALPCGTAAASDADVVSMNRAFYDHHGFTTAPTKGEVTETDEAKAWALVGGVATPTWLATSTSSYDPWGRPTDVTDVRTNHTTTVYNTTTNPGGPVTTVATTTLQGTSTNTVEPSWGAVTAAVDVNNKQTDVTYDALGRSSQVWGPTHPKASFPSQPSASFAYLTRTSGGVNAITTSSLNAAGAYTVAYTLYDGLARARQTQAVSLANGHVGTVFTDTVYDDKGQVAQQSDHFDPSVQPSTTLFGILSWQPHNQTVTQYDLAGRTTATILEDQGIEQSRTTTTYGGDRVNVVPPAGGVATTAVSDAEGRAVELRQYHDPAHVGSNTRTDYDLVAYHYNRKAQRDSWTDNAGNVWTATFDFLGRATSGHDPDKGNASAAYNDAGDVLSTTDANNQALAYTYDTLGRKTGEYLGTTTGPKLASFVYDPTGAKGQLASQSRWIGADEYRIKVNGYTPDYKPTSISYTIPATQSGLAGTYTFGYSYKPNGSPATLSYPNAGGLSAETLTYVYDATDGLANQLQTSFPNAGNYVVETAYNANGQVGFEQFQQTAGNFLQRSFTYDDQHRLSDTTTIRQVTPQPVDDTTYRYDGAGNIVKSVETPAVGAADTQCYTYDYAARLSDAWTPGNGDCTATRSAATLGGPAPYWLSWTFDPVGDRLTQTSHATAGNTASSSTYPPSGSGSVRPHAITSVQTTGPGVNTTASYTYDNAGNMLTRPGTTGSQTLTWDAEEHLSTVVDGGKTSAYIYAPDGTRLLQDDGTNVTVYLPGEDLVKNKSTGTVTANRYYSWGKQTIGTRASGGPLTWLVSDSQGTQQIQVASGTQAITQRRQTPYGTPRGNQPPWSNPHGYVGGTNDATGLVHEGAREYDPGIGRFISVDPLSTPDDPAALVAYGYARNNPTNFADPTGLIACDAYGDCTTRPGAPQRGSQPPPRPHPTGPGTGSDCSASARFRAHVECQERGPSVSTSPSHGGGSPHGGKKKPTVICMGAAHNTCDPRTMPVTGTSSYRGGVTVYGLYYGGAYHYAISAPGQQAYILPADMDPDMVASWLSRLSSATHGRAHKDLLTRPTAFWIEAAYDEGMHLSAGDFFQIDIDSIEAQGGLPGLSDMIWTGKGREAAPENLHPGLAGNPSLSDVCGSTCNGVGMSRVNIKPDTYRVPDALETWTGVPLPYAPAAGLMCDHVYTCMDSSNS